MSRALRRIAVLLAAAALMLLPAAGEAHAASNGSFLGGINIPGPTASSTPAEADREISLAKQLHARIVRIEVAWATLEPSGPTLDPIVLSFMDRLTADAQAAGIKVLVMIASTPCWASSAPSKLLAECALGRSGPAASWPPSEDATYAAMLTEFAQRYATRISAIEIWNEPDQANEAYFAGPDKAPRYAALLRAAYPAIKSVAPNIQVLGGSMVGSNGRFLKALYAAGIKGYYDGLSVHFYDLTLGALRAIHETQLANGDHTPLWLDEFGWTSCWPRHKTQEQQACVTAKVQARNLRDSIREMSRAPYLAAATVYKLQDSSEELFGALTTKGAHKSSFKALGEAFQRPSGPFSAVTLHLSRHGSHVLASGSGPVGDFLALEAFQGSRLRYKALFIQNRFNEYAVSLPAVLGTHGLRVRVYQYWTGPSRDASKSI